MQSQKSPGRELAEKMWYDVTGQIPSESRPAPVALSETGSAAESPPSRINIRLPDLDQPVTEIPVEISERSGVPPLSHAAMVTLVASGDLGEPWSFGWQFSREGILPPKRLWSIPTFREFLRTVRQHRTSRIKLPPRSRRQVVVYRVRWRET